MTATSRTVVDTPRRPHTGSAPAWQAGAVRWGTLLLIVVTWQILCYGPLRNNDYLAPPSEVLTKGMTSVFGSDTVLALWQTTSRFLEAFGLVAVAGTIIGLSLGRIHRQIFHGARDVVTILYALPMVPFYPLFVLWLGLGTRSEIAFGVIHGLIPVILITMTASADVATTLLTSGQTMGATRIQRLRLIIMPAVLPDVVGALKIGAALTLLGVLLAELMISVDGVGSFILNQVTNHQAAPLDAMVLVVCAGVIVINAALAMLERRESHWRY